MRQRELEEQMRRKREESYRMGGFMDNVSNAVRKLLAFKCHIFGILLYKTISPPFFLQREREMRMNSSGSLGLAGKMHSRSENS